MTEWALRPAEIGDMPPEWGSQPDLDEHPDWVGSIHRFRRVHPEDFQPTIEEGAPFSVVNADGHVIATGVWGARLDTDRLDTDIRCTHRDAAGQCLDHQGHAGDHQYPAQETR